uniref:Uncharacterized protein n=1 Tax=Meloidogyne incognita TaxID=6306 RepID=A0A914MHJ2_MELIC
MEQFIFENDGGGNNNYIKIFWKERVPILLFLILIVAIMHFSVFFLALLTR